MVEFSPGTPLVIGILADVSGSMRGSIDSIGISAINRLEAFSAALEDLVKRAAASVHELSRSPTPTAVRLFAYGFGFGNALSAFLGRGGPNVRDLFAPNGEGERTVDVLDLASNWEMYLANVRSMSIDMFGTTPMREALEVARSRFAAEISGNPVASVLFILSDGDPTDGDRSSILRIVGDIRQSGTIVVSCFVTDVDITEPQRLYGQYQVGWSNAAKLMFDCASRVNNTGTRRTMQVASKAHPKGC